MTIGVYLFKTILISGLLLGYYRVFLRNKSFHRYNRYFLLGIPAISFVLPGLRLTLPDFWKQTADSSIHLLGVANGTLEEAVTVYARQAFWKNLPWESICILTSVLVSLLLLLRFYRSFHSLRVLRRNSPRYESGGAEIYFVSMEGTPFSFFNCIFWNEEQDLNSQQGQQILRHELYHVHHKHSADILVIEMARILCWFNPFIYLIRKEIRMVHEFLADAYAASGTDELEYAELLISNARSKSIPITHPFFQDPIKRRITMLTTYNKIKSGLLGRIMILPVAVVLLGLFAFRLQNHPALLFNSPKTIRVVVDAGHGGSETGAMVNGTLEKNINLQIAKKIQQLAKNYNIDVIMTRESDETPGHAATLHDDLLYRAALPAKDNADLFISIHTNADSSAGSTSGFEIYVPPSRSSVYPGSVELGSGISGFIQNHFPVAPVLKQRPTGILILSKATVPAVLIECGNLCKKTDLDFIVDQKNQEKIALDILNGIRQYSLQMPAFLESLPSPDTLTMEALQKLDPDSIYSSSFNAIQRQVKIRFKDGKEFVALLPGELNFSDTSGMDRKVEFVASLPNEMKSVDTSGIYKKVEIEAEYPGGQQAWIQYLIKNLKYPPEAVSRKIQGTVMVQFVVEKDGTLTDVHALDGPGELRAESVLAIRNSGKWNPAKDHGKIVRSFHKQPVVYRLEK